MKRRTAALAFLGLGLGLGAIGCGSSSATKAIPSTPMASVPSVAAPSSAPLPVRRHVGPQCRTSQLNISLARYTADAVGPHHAILVIKNTTGPSCQMYGYPKLAFYGPHHHPMSLATSRYSYPVAPAPVTLRRGQSAWTEIDWTIWDPNAYVKVGSCRPAPTSVDVTSPGETESVNLKWGGGKSCWAGWLGVQPLRAGAGTGDTSP
jgi:Protein of unknown function (DUF4232)